MENKKLTLGIILLLVLFGLVYYITGIIGIIELTISLIMYCLIFYFFINIWKKLRKKEIINFIDFGKIFIYKISLSIYTIIFIIFGFAYYNNSINPATMPQYTVSNGEKTFIFQGMSHIARKEFYNQIRLEIKNIKTNSGVLFFEGVKAGTKESNDKFDQAIGINFKPDLYKNMSKLYGITFQDNTNFLNLVNNLDYNVDLSIDEVIKIYEKKVKNQKKNNNSKQEVVNISDEILNQLNKLNDKELKILVYINQAILNLIIKNDASMKNLLENFGNPILLDVILEDRNKNLAKNIEKSEYKKIFVIYGLLHYEGLLKILQKNDPKWKLISTKYFYPISEKK